MKSGNKNKYDKNLSKLLKTDTRSVFKKKIIHSNLNRSNIKAKKVIKSNDSKLDAEQTLTDESNIIFRKNRRIIFQRISNTNKVNMTKTINVDNTFNGGNIAGMSTNDKKRRKE